MKLLDNYKKNSFEEIFYPNVPFENSDINPLKGYILSVKLIISKPFIFYKIMHVNKGYFKPTLFAVINIILSTFFTNLYMHLDWLDTPVEQMNTVLAQSDEFPASIGTTLQNLAKQLPAFSFDISTIASQCFGLLINLTIIIMVWQTALLLFRLADNGMQATWRVICYSSTALLVNLLPINQLVTSMTLFGWAFILIVIGLSEAHELTWKRTLLAAFSLPTTAILFLIPFLLSK